MDADSYVLEVSRYIHMNPVKAGLADRPEQYPYSSMGVYAKKRSTEEWLTTEWMLERVARNEREARKKLYAFTVDGKAKEWDPFKQALGGYLLGADAFVRKVKAERVPLKKDGSVARLKLLQKNDDYEEVLARIERFKVGEKLKRKLVGYYLKRYTYLKLKEIGERLGGMKESAVCRMVMRFEAEAEERKDYRDAIADLEKMSIVKP